MRSHWFIQSIDKPKQYLLICEGKKKIILETHQHLSLKETNSAIHETTCSNVVINSYWWDSLVECLLDTNLKKIINE